MKKLFALLLVVMMGVLPVAASAAAVPYVRFAVSNPVLSYGTTADDAQTLDLSGVATQFTTYVQDETNVLAVLELLAKGEKALAIDLLLQDNAFTALVEGMTYAFTLSDVSAFLPKADETDNAEANAFLAKLQNIDFSGIMDAASGIQVVENGQQDVVFFDDETLTANASSVDIDNATFKKIFDEVAKIGAEFGLPINFPEAEITAHADMYTTEDGLNTRVDYTVDVAPAEGDAQSMTGMNLMRIDEAGNVDYYQETFDANDEGTTVQFALYDVEGETSKAASFLLNAIAGEETVLEFYVDYTPETTETGTNHTLIAGVDQQGVTLFAFEADAVTDDAGVATWSVTFGTTPESGAESALSMEYDRDNDGAFTFAGQAEGTYFHSTANIAITAGEEEMPVIDLTGLKTIDILSMADMDEETMQALQADVMAPSMTALGVLASVPGIGQLMESEG